MAAQEKQMQGHPLGRARAALRALHRAQNLGELGSDFASPVAADSGNLEEQLLNADRRPGARSMFQGQGDNRDLRVQQSAAEKRDKSSMAAGSLGQGTASNSLRRFQRAVSTIQQEQQVIKSFPSNRDRLASIFQRGSLTLGTGMGLYAQAALEETREAPGLFALRSDAKAISGLIVGSWMNIFLICAPLGYLAQLLHWGPIAIFLLNFFALVPLALTLGEVTEDLALRFGDTAGGLLNATFGNVTELILSIAALTKGLNVVVAMSLIGSVLSNMLLVLGMCFFFGGARFKEQSFNTMMNKACCSLLFLTCIALSVPTAAHQLYGKEEMPQSAVENMSHGTAILLVIVYACYLLFSLKTHNQANEGHGDEESGGGSGGQNDGSSRDPARSPPPDEASDASHTEVPVLSLSGAFFLLTSITIMVAISSEFLTGAVEAVSKKSGLNERFLGLIVLPIAGNACEHITAIFVAVKNKMDLAIGVALGSSIQIACFVLPVVVLVGWIIGPQAGHQPFTLNFDAFITLLLTLSVIHAYFLSSDGTSNWLAGVQLCSTYFLIALLYIFIKDPSDGPADLLAPSLAA